MRDKTGGHLPCRWLFTDSKRLADPLPAILALKPGDGVVFRHYGSENRLALAQAAARLCRQRGIVMVIAGSAVEARRIGAAGCHRPEHALPGRGGGMTIVTAAVHGLAGLVQARRQRVSVVFISPVFVTASHPGVAGLGPLRLAGLASLAMRWGMAAYALGGMDDRAMHRLSALPLRGYGAIAALAKRNRRP